jgi:hypothetical protein
MAYTLVFRRYAPFETFGGGFEGDNRTTSSTDLNDTARTTGIVSFEPGYVGTVTASSSGTVLHTFGSKVANLLGKHVSKVTSSVSISTASIDGVRLTAHTAGANPMVPLAPDIDTYIDIEVVFRDQSLDITGRVRGDDFPNAEVFLMDAFGNASMVFEYSTSGGQTTGPMTRLAGSHSKQSLGAFLVKINLGPGGEFA